MSVPPAPADSVYLREALPQIPRLLSALDREPHSVSHGSFDRVHWAWKLRDFPLNMAQAAACPLALLWRHPFPGNPCYASAPVYEWVVAALQCICLRQHRNGSFDSVGPFTQDHGVTLAMVYTLTETLRILDADAPATLREAVAAVVRRGCEFARRSDEDYAFISNHRALFALAFLNAAALLEHAAYRQQAEEILDEILVAQSPDGWYREYDGPDPGYESLGIGYLATCWRRTGAARLLESLRRSVEFYAHCVHPDGSVGGVYGSRHTQLYFPAGFETLRAEIPLAGSVAGFLRARLERQNVVTPAVSDAENLPSLMHAYLQASLLKASLAAKATHDPADPEGRALPCETLEGMRHFPAAAITVVGRARYYAVTSAAKGGVCRIFDKQRGSVAYEDAGYMVRAGGRRWTSQRIGLGRRTESAQPDEVSCATTLALYRQELPSALRFMLLRVLNLTVFRNPAAGRWIRRWIVARLITDVHPGPLRLQRSMIFAPADIVIRDRLELTAPITVEEVAVPRGLTAVHMGSAKYFHPTELEATPQMSVDHMVGALDAERAAEAQLVIPFA